jgi:hypothetical protein
MRFAEQFIKNLTDLFGPIPSLIQFPSVNDIADEVERVRFSFAQKIEQGGSIECFRPDVKIGKEDGLKNLRRGVRHGRQESPVGVANLL